ncbi:hypothetical protein ACS0TY_018170 [Phlomoides rotata]
MWSENRIPVQDRSLKRHHTARYYVDRVKESLTTRVSKLICAIFLGLLFLVGIITFILWLSLRPHRPRFHIHDFSIQESSLTYNLTARNSNSNIGIYYDSMELTLYYHEDQTMGDSPLLYPFYQEPKNTTIIAGQLSAAALKLWQQVAADRARGEVIFRLEVTSVIRFKISSWDSKRHRMHVNCAVRVGPNSSILPLYKDKKCPVYFGR